MDRLDPIRVNGPWLRHHVFTGPSRLHMFASKEAIRQHLQPSGPKNQDQRVPPVARRSTPDKYNAIYSNPGTSMFTRQAARRILVSSTGRLHHLEAFWPASNFRFNSSLSRAGNSVNVAYFVALVIAGLLCLILFYSTTVMMLGCLCYLSFSWFSPRLACYVNLLSGMEFNASFNLIAISGQIFEAG